VNAPTKTADASTQQTLDQAMNPPPAQLPSAPIAPEPPKEPRTFKELLQSPKYQDEIRKALGDQIPLDRVTKILLSAFNKNPELMGCTIPSLYQACIDCCTLNLWPGPQGHIYLVPRNINVAARGETDRWESHAQATIGYRGMIELAYRTGQVVGGSFTAQTIHANDAFEFEYGSDAHISHRPKLGDRGPMIGAWAGVIPKDGRMVFYVMDKADLDAIRARSRAKSGPWFTDEREMHCKTVIRRMWKYLPSSVQDRYAEWFDRDMEREFDLKAAEVIPPSGGRFGSLDGKSPGKSALDDATAEVDRRTTDQPQPAGVPFP
jgi:recombination protein RecT